MSKNGSLTETQSRALKMLLEGMTATEVAKALGKGKRTIDRWRASKPFKAALSRINEKIQDEAESQVADRLSSLKSLALDTIEECLGDREESTRNRLNAARLAGNWSGLEFDLDKAFETFDKYGISAKKVKGGWFLFDDRDTEMFFLKECYETYESSHPDAI